MLLLVDGYRQAPTTRSRVCPLYSQNREDANATDACESVGYVSFHEIAWSRLGVHADLELEFDSTLVQVCKCERASLRFHLVVKCRENLSRQRSQKSEL